MATYTKQSLFESFPAYDIFRREADSGDHVNITADDILGLRVVDGKGNTKYYETFSAGSVVSYALEYNECPIEAVEHAKKNGHELHWINARGSCLTSSPREKEKVVMVEYGMKVRFQGLIATIEKAPNHNLKFVPIK